MGVGGGGVVGGSRNESAGEAHAQFAIDLSHKEGIKERENGGEPHLYI